MLKYRALSYLTVVWLIGAVKVLSAATLFSNLSSPASDGSTGAVSFVLGRHANGFALSDSAELDGFRIWVQNAENTPPSVSDDGVSWDIREARVSGFPGDPLASGIFSLSDPDVSVTNVRATDGGNLLEIDVTIPSSVLLVGDTEYYISFLGLGENESLYWNSRGNSPNNERLILAGQADDWNVADVPGRGFMFEVKGILVPEPCTFALAIAGFSILMLRYRHHIRPT